MMRRLFTLTCALSLLFCLLTLSLWIPSYRRGDSLLFSRRASNGAAITYWVGSQSGSVVLVVSRVTGVDASMPVNRWDVFETDQSAAVPRHWWERIGFAGLHQEASFAAIGMTVSFTGIGLPHWLVAVIFAVLPAQWLRRRLTDGRAQRRVAAGACLACGYDLKGNGSGICPECGMQILPTAKNLP